MTTDEIRFRARTLRNRAELLQWEAQGLDLAASLLEVLEPEAALRAVREQRLSLPKDGSSQMRTGLHLAETCLEALVHGRDQALSSEPLSGQPR